MEIHAVLDITLIIVMIICYDEMTKDDSVVIIIARSSKLCPT